MLEVLNTFGGSVGTKWIYVQNSSHTMPKNKLDNA
jgi:hypothetical protein